MSRYSKPMEELREEFRLHTVATPLWSLCDFQTYARVVSVYDGDSVQVVFPLLNKYFRFRVRLYGIDACEMTSDQSSNRDLAVKAKRKMFEMITGHTPPSSFKAKDFDAFLNSDVYLVWLDCKEFDKYGRLLACVKKTKNDHQTYSEILLQEKLAYEYDGGTKLSDRAQLDTLQ